jgi:uroporphyrin-3 C-methyltransferase
VSETPIPLIQSSPAEAPDAPNASSASAGKLPRWWPMAALAVAALAGIGLGWQSLSRQQTLEQELVRRWETVQLDAREARASAALAQQLTRDIAAKVALLDARLAEVALQRGQLEELIQSMSRSRDENVIVDIEASIRVAMQQSAITGSAEPLIVTLRQADERLLRYKQPRMEGVRRAVLRDLDRVKAISGVDVATLTIKLDEVVRLLDELPLLARADLPSEMLAQSVPRKEAAASSPGASPDNAVGKLEQGWSQVLRRWDGLTRMVWDEARNLLRVTRIEHPEAMLVAPEQSYFLRENLKLRLLNARLALLSRQFDTAQADLRNVQENLSRYFDPRSRKLVAATELLRQVTGQARQVNLVRPDDTLAALLAAAAGR